MVLAVDPAIAKELGWDTAREIGAASDLVSAIQTGKINLAMTSASQSTPGAAFYLAMYTALTGQRVLTSNDLNNAQAPWTSRRCWPALTAHRRTSTTSTALLITRRRRANETNAIVIYESLATQMNQALMEKGQQPMTIFYVDRATAIADMPLRYVDNGETGRLEQYQKLVAFLARPEIQKRLQALGRRTNPIGMQCEDCDPAVFNPAWGINTNTEFQEMVFPKSPVTRAARWTSIKRSSASRASPSTAWIILEVWTVSGRDADGRRHGSSARSGAGGRCVAASGPRRRHRGLRLFILKSARSASRSSATFLQL